MALKILPIQVNFIYHEYKTRCFLVNLPCFLYPNMQIFKALPTMIAFSQMQKKKYSETSTVSNTMSLPL